jgi:hypothetical protein
MLEYYILSSGQQSPQKNSLFSRLADHFPFISYILKQQYPQPSNNKGSYVSETLHFSEASLDPDNCEVPDKTSLDLDDTSEVLGVYAEEPEPLSNNVDDVLSSLRFMLTSLNSSLKQTNNHCLH